MEIVMLKGKIIMERIKNNLENFEMKELEAEVEEEIKVLKKKENKLKIAIDAIKYLELEKKKIEIIFDIISLLLFTFTVLF